jgi:plastocyanin
MPSITGYPSTTKQSKHEHAGVEPIGAARSGLSVRATSHYQNTGSDAAEAASTTTVNNATAHTAKKGDVISWTSGDNDGHEYAVIDTDTDSITVAGPMIDAPSAGETFNILRPKVPEVSSGGGTTTSTAGVDAESVYVHDYASASPATNADSNGNVADNSWTELIAATSNKINSINGWDSGGAGVEIGIGAAASEARKIVVPPGGFEGNLPIQIAAGSRVSIRSLGGTISSGLLILHLMR